MACIKQAIFNIIQVEIDVFIVVDYSFPVLA